MSRFIVRGGKKLKGEIKVSGSKNALSALLPASLLIKGRTIFKNVPKIRDVDTLIKILAYLGAEIRFDDSELLIDTKNVEYRDLLIPEVKLLRSSLLFLAPVLFRFGRVRTYFPGGDVIGARPIDTHLDGLSQLGAKFNIKGEIIEGTFEKFDNTLVLLRESSVTATETLMLASCFSKKEIDLRLVALEPHVQALGRFLMLAGYSVKGLGTPFLRIKKGQRINKEVIFKIPPDYIEAGTFIALAGATKSEILIVNANPEELDSVFSIMKEMRFDYEIKHSSILVKPAKLRGTKIQTGLYPKFPSDLQPPFGVLATQAEGVTLIHEWLYENRFGYLNELKLMGANVEILDPHRAIILGPTPLYGKEVNSLDIRAGITLLIGALLAEGETVINEVEKIDRGYEKIEERLRMIGADIKRVD
ncbi:MAG: UDP-N-acetylglucosamine 1-carboxyvinyltransferase [Patescibacteria group bacterium]|nr:UDP-N-acetylglucosamine 1-carboxyvinyltransferase [Patescibacteria group bacterium]